MGEAAGDGDLAHLLAESAAGSPEAERRLSSRMRSEFEALLSQGLAGEHTMSLADTGALVQRQWRQWSLGRAAADVPAGDTKGSRSKKPKGRKAAAGAKGRKGTIVASASSSDAGMATADLDAKGSADPLFPPYIEHAAVEMQRLVRELVARADPRGQAMATLSALDALEGLDPALARVVRLRWFAGLGPDALAHVLGASEPEAQRRWLKARAFLAAAARPALATSP